jgi:hypothetical protein
VAEVVAEADRLGEVLVERQRAGDRPRDLRDLERVGQARAEVIALWRDEDLGLVLQAPERLGVHDPVAIALQRRAQPAVVLRARAARRPRARGQRRQPRVLELTAARGVALGDRARVGVRIHCHRFSHRGQRLPRATARAGVRCARCRVESCSLSSLPPQIRASS